MEVRLSLMYGQQSDEDWRISNQGCSDFPLGYSDPEQYEMQRALRRIKGIAGMYLVRKAHSNRGS